jgi:2-amino-4-hydroxy-6-hydroxymethyldihydropteridine diphosphokinase
MLRRQPHLHESFTVRVNNYCSALVALGANLPFGGLSPVETLKAALASLVVNDIQVVAVSRFFQTPCFPIGAGPDYVNAACVLRFSADATPETILMDLHRTEKQFGRERMRRWGMRTLDLDLLAINDSVVPDPKTQSAWRDLPTADQARLAPDELILPHPRLQDRAFVLIPLADVAPDWRHPLLGLTVLQMIERLPTADRAALVPLNA